MKQATDVFHYLSVLEENSCIFSCEAQNVPTFQKLHTFNVLSAVRTLTVGYLLKVSTYTKSLFPSFISL